MGAQLLARAVCGAASILAAAALALAQVEPVPNVSFEEGAETPAGWSLSGGSGAWQEQGRTGERCISVTGAGEDSSYWVCDGYRLAPSTLYRIGFWARALPDASGGCIISGSNVVNRDYRPTEEWTEYSFAFVTPADTTDAYVRLGQWHKRGTVLFDDISLSRVAPVHVQRGDIELGEGERIRDGVYECRPRLSGDGSNHSRCLVRHSAGFNSHRWLFRSGAEVVYRHRAGSLAQTTGTIEVNVGYYRSGRLLVQASRDGESWETIGEVGEQTTKQFDVPAELYPAREVFVRLLGAGATEGGAGEDSAPGEFQVYSYSYRAELEAEGATVAGSTRYLEILRMAEDLDVTIAGLGGPPTAEPSEVVLTVSDRAGRSRRLGAVVEVAMAGEKARRFGTPFELAAGEPRREVVQPFDVRSAGQASLRVAVEDRRGKELFAARTQFNVPPLFAADYGSLLVGDSHVGTLWWCPATHKVSRTRPAPTKRYREMTLDAAKNEYEALQLVLRPERDMTDVEIEVDDLRGPRGAVISRENIDIDLVGYVPVQVPTDAAGCVGDWPDPLPHYDGPFDVPASTNQPIWLTVYVPPDARAGDYTANVTLRSGDGSAVVPLGLHVYDFALSKETHVQSGFGISTGNIRRYHNLETDDELRRVWELYMQNWAAHRISPYDPMPLDPIRVSISGIRWQGGSRVTDEKHAGTQSLMLADDTATGTPDARYADRVPINPASSYRISWWARTAEAGQGHMVTLQTYDAGGEWLWGKNIDMRVQGTGKWQRHEYDLAGRFAPECRSAALVLRPTLWSEEGEQAGTAWFDDVSLLQAGGEESMLEDGGFEATFEDVNVELDFTDFDRAAEHAFDELGFTAFRLRLQGMGGGTFHSRRKGNLAGFEQGTPEYERLFGQYCCTIQDHLEAKGWLDKAYIYWFDEPAPRDYDFVKEGMELIRRAAPKLTRMLTEQPEPELDGYVDMWCPVLHNYSPEDCQAQQAGGRRIWWYVCTGPKAPYTTLFLDHPAVNMRLWLWFTWKYQVDGILVWQSNYWNGPLVYPPPKIQNPWTDPMSYQSGYGRPVGHVGYWGNGDGRFIYPPNRDPQNDRSKYIEGPVNSIRWEMLRDGMEEYEYFYLLREAIEDARRKGKGRAAIAEAERLLEIPDAIITDFTHYTKDPSPLETHRRKVAKAIEGLRR